MMHGESSLRISIIGMLICAVPRRWLRGGRAALIIDQARAEANIAREVSSAEVADLTLLREVQKELGIKGR